jgi:solute carrier family 66 (lysosomal lysine-arginine transporter), member 1
VQFLIVWLLGDIFNILGAVLQHVLPTMLILAIYYTIADIVLLGQCFYYRGFTWRDDVLDKPGQSGNDRSPAGLEEQRQQNERSALLASDRERRGPERSADLSHLSPALPLVSDVPVSTTTMRSSQAKMVATRGLAVLMVFVAGVAGWWLSLPAPSASNPDNVPGADNDELTLDPWGQAFGWLCAALYLGSRAPQILLNWRRKSTEGISFMFFLLACLGNLTYVLSILAYNPRCGHGGSRSACDTGEAMDFYRRYILVNASWLAGSAGTLLLDLVIFVQIFVYDKDEQKDEAEAVDERVQHHDQRPLLDRFDSR